MPITSEEAFAVYKEADCLYKSAEVEAALSKMADEITTKLQHKNPILLSVMRGGLIPTGYLVSKLLFPLQLDYIHATRYGGGTSGGTLEWIFKPAMSLEGRVVLLIDDILDEGLTLEGLIDYCKDAGAAEVYSAVLVNKLHDRKNHIEADFVGLDVEDRYVFGYGMDYKGYLRNMPGIYAVKEDG